MYGFLERDWFYMQQAISCFEEIEKVVLFGSRALGNYKTGSDVDLAIYGADVDRKTVRRLSEQLNENYPLPYFFDVVDYNALENENLIEHIDTYGKVIFRKKV